MPGIRDDIFNSQRACFRFTRCVFSGQCAGNVGCNSRIGPVEKSSSERIFAKRVSVCFYGDQSRLSSCHHAASEWKPQPFAYQCVTYLTTGCGTYVTHQVFFENFSYIIYSLLILIYMYSFFILTHTNREWFCWNIINLKEIICWI